MPAGGDIATHLSALDSADPSHRKHAVEAIRRALRQAGPALRLDDPKPLFEALRTHLHDENWNVAHQCIQLLSELVVAMRAAIDGPFGIVLPAIVENLGDSKVVIRKASMQCLAQYLKVTRNLPLVINALVHSGLENQDWKVRHGSALGVVNLITDYHEDVDWKQLIEYLVSRLKDSSDSVIQSSVEALAHVRATLSESFSFYIRMLTIPQQQLFAKYQAKIEAKPLPPSGSTKVPPVGDGSSSTGSSRRSAGTRRSRTTSGGAASSGSARPPSGSATPAATAAAAAAADLDFGFVPHQIVKNLGPDSNWQIRGAAVEELKNLVTKVSDISPMLSHLNTFFRFLNDLVADSNFKVCLTTLQILNILVQRLGVHVNPLLDLFLPQLVEKLGDNKIVIRQANLALFRSLMHVLSPKPILNTLLNARNHANWKVREEVVHTIIIALLTHGKYDFDFESISRNLASSAMDDRSRVQIAAMEALVVINSMVGSRKLFSYVTNADDTTILNLRARIENSQLSFINAQGLVEYPSFVQQQLNQIEGKGQSSSHQRPTTVIVNSAAGAQSPVLSPSNQYHIQHQQRHQLRQQQQQQQQQQPQQHRRSHSRDNSGASIDDDESSTSSPQIKGSRGPSRGKMPWDVKGSLKRVNNNARSSGSSAGSRSIPPRSPGSGYQQHPDVSDFSIAEDSWDDDPPPARPTKARQTSAGPVPPHLSGDSSGDHGSETPSWLSDEPLDAAMHPPPASSHRTPSAGRRKQSLSRYSSEPDMAPHERERVGGKGRASSAGSDVGGPNGSSSATSDQVAGKLNIIKRREAAKKAAAAAESGGYASIHGGGSSEPSGYFPSTGPGVPHSRRSSGQASAGTSRSGSGSTGAATNWDEQPVGGAGHRNTYFSDEDAFPPDPPTPNASDAAAAAAGTSTQSRQLSKATMNRLAAKQQAARADPPAHHDAPIAGRRSATSSASSTDHTRVTTTSGRSTMGRETAKKVEEMASEDLRPSPNAAREYQSAFAGLGASDWEVNYEAITSVRRLAIFHADTTIAPNLRDLLRKLLPQIDNLRSQVSKNALTAMGDFFKALRRQMEPTLDQTVPAVLKKVTDTNTFLVSEAQKTLHVMLQSVNEGRALHTVMSQANHRNPAVRTTVAALVSRSIEAMGPRVASFKDLDRLLPVIVQFLNEGALEARHEGKRALWGMSAHVNIEKVGSRVLSERALKQALGVIEEIRARGGVVVNDSSSTMRRTTTSTRGSMHRPPSHPDESAGGSPSSGRQRGVTASAGTSRRSAPSRARSATTGSSAKSEMAQVSTLCKNLDSSDWRARHDALKAVTDLAESHPSDFGAHVVKVFDHVAPRLTDTNAKVNLVALQSVERIVCAVKDDIAPIVHTVVPPLSTNLAASSSTLRDHANRVFDAMIENIDHCALLQPFANVAHFANVRIKPAMLDKIRVLVYPVYSKKQGLIVRYALPVALGLIDENKSDIRTANTKLLRSLHEVMGRSLFEHASSLPEKAQDKLKAIVS